MCDTYTLQKVFKLCIIRMPGTVAVNVHIVFRWVLDTTDRTTFKQHIVQVLVTGVQKKFQVLKWLYFVTQGFFFMASDTIQLNWTASYCSHIIIKLTYCKNITNNFARAVALQGIAVLVLYIFCTYIQYFQLTAHLLVDM